MQVAHGLREVLACATCTLRVVWQCCRCLGRLWRSQGGTREERGAWLLLLVVIIYY